MVNQQLVEYIRAVQTQGFSESTIRDVLIKNGWQVSDINEALSEIKKIEDILKTNIPIAPGLINTTQQAPQEPVLENTLPTTNHIEYNSPYSIGLAIVLFGALLILVNKIIDDSAISSMSINGKLIFDAFIILPFLIAAFILHGSFSDDNKRYVILSQPYFVTSAFLLIRLLWDTSAYIMNKNATYGVYVVLILIIIVLTGIVLSVQKFIKN